MYSASCKGQRETQREAQIGFNPSREADHSTISMFTFIIFTYTIKTRRAALDLNVLFRNMIHEYSLIPLPTVCQSGR